jgi:hypothetical protein
MVENFFVVAEGKKNRRKFENKEKQRKGKWGFEVLKYLVRRGGGFLSCCCGFFGALLLWDSFFSGLFFVVRWSRSRSGTCSGSFVRM